MELADESPGCGVKGKFTAYRYGDNSVFTATSLRKLVDHLNRKRLPKHRLRLSSCYASLAGAHRYHRDTVFRKVPMDRLTELRKAHRHRWTDI